MSFDVVVVGGGVMGSALAWRLSARGLGTLVCDPGEPHRDAGWAAAGMLCAQAEASEAGPFLDLLLAAEDRWAELLGRFHHQRTGVLHVALNAEERAALVRQSEWQRARGLPVVVLDGDAVRQLESGLSNEVVAANFFPRGGQVDARAVAPGLLDEALRLGAEVRRGTVERIEVEGGRVRGVRVDGEEVAAKAVIVAAGAWSSHIEGLGLVPEAVIPVRGQMLAYAVAPPPVSRAVFGAGGYILPRHGDRVVVGSTMERTGFDARVTPEARATLEDRGRRLCPTLATAPVAESWAGLRPATADGLPALGPTPIEGLHLAVGLFRNGILLAPLASELVVRAMLGDQEIPGEFAAMRLYGAT